jgi:hypothetical protein
VNARWIHGILATHGYRERMPSSLRAKVALIGFLAILLIPIGTSSLRGLTHVLTCREESDTPFTIEVPGEGGPVISSSMVLEREPTGAAPDRELCGGLLLDLAAGSTRDDRTEVRVTITNRSDYGWRGTVQLRLDATTIPVSIGTVDPGSSATDTIELRVRPGSTHELAGSLLIGP